MPFVTWALLGCGGVHRGAVGDGGAAHHADLASVELPDLFTPDFASPSGPDLALNGQCLPGEYLGQFQGSVLAGGFIPIQTSGTVDLTLDTTGGEFFAIMNGQLSGDASGNPYSADLVGTLDCSALKLEMGQVQNGKVTVSGLVFHFVGPLTADYDPQTVSFVNGTWNIKEPTGPGTGSGTWQATHK
jgi:hypothetical protein